MTTSSTYPALQLRPREDKRLRAGHLWIYSNEVDTQATPLKGFNAGDLVCVQDSQGKALGIASINPQALLCARILTRDAAARINTRFFKQQLSTALSLRQQLFDQPHYRWVHGEGDFLPGLIIDRYGDDVVIQLNTVGMDRLRDDIVAAVVALVSPRSVVLRNDGRGRSLENLPAEVVVAHGTPPEQLLLSENGVTFAAPALEGQKTGWFYDHRSMRSRLSSYVPGKRVLDVFAYLGSFGVQAAAFGAAQVTSIDVSSLSADWVGRNAALNGVADRLTPLTGDAFTLMEQLLAQGEKYDVVIVDPPAFIPRAKDHGKGVAAYQKLNALAIRLTQPGGVVFSASCSMHLKRDELLGVMQKAARANDRRLQLLEETHQAPDHPVHPAIAETQYLKGFIARVLHAD